MIDREPRADAGHREAMQDLLHACAPGAFEPGPCPAGSVLAAFVEGTVAGTAREEVERHLAGCERCFGAVEVTMEAWLEECAPRGLLRRLPRWLRRPSALIAATVVLAAGVGVIAWSVFGPGRNGPSESPLTDARLQALISSLGNEHPEIFAGFESIGAHDRREARLPATRGEGAALIFPRGTLLNPRPVFTWALPTGSEATSIELMDESLEPLWRRPATRSPFSFPPDVGPMEPGARYVWRLVHATPFSARETAVATFRCASLRERAIHSRAFEIIASFVPPPVHHLASAHYAARKEALGAALSHARAFTAARPDSLIGRETLRYVLVQLRSPEADRIHLDASER